LSALASLIVRVRPLPLDVGRADLRRAQLAFDVGDHAVERGVDRRVDVDAVEEVRAALQVEAEPDGLLPRPPLRDRLHERRRQQHDRRRGEDERQDETIGCLHDFCSFSRGSRGALDALDRAAIDRHLHARSDLDRQDLVTRGEDASVHARRHHHLVVLLEVGEAACRARGGASARAAGAACRRCRPAAAGRRAA
jgi:hypothetical protein